MPGAFAQAPAPTKPSLEKLIEREFTPLQDTVTAVYLDQLGQKLARASGMAVPLTIKPIDTQEPRAIALPA